MREPFVRAAGLALAVMYSVFITWLYVRQPQTVAQVTGGLASAVGAYRIDEQAFADGLQFFRRDQFIEARLAFGRADPAERDARTQFYVAYSYYRQGWGRFSYDDRLFAQGLDAVKKAEALTPDGRLVVADPDLKMQTADELKVELQRGMERDASDFNPLRLFSPRK